MHDDLFIAWNPHTDGTSQLIDDNMKSMIWGTFYKHGLTLIPSWISNPIHYKVWDEIT